MRPIARVWMPVILVSVMGCASPEADRTRGGGAGADPGNRAAPAPTEMHLGAQPYHKTPCRVPLGCTGPMPVFGS